MPQRKLPPADPATQAAASELRRAWDEMLVMVGEARNAIDDPTLWPPDPSRRNLAEGYRYVTGFLYGSIARSFGPTAEFPYFVRMIQPLNRSTIDNSDAIYLYAPIDGNYSYTIKGRTGDTRHWRGEPAITNGRKAPHYVFLQTASGHSGDSGELDEMKPGSRANCAVLDSSQLQVNADGSFEILLAPECPAGYSGNFMSTRKTKIRRNAEGVEVTREYVAEMVGLRELFGDWEHEEAMDLFIYRNDLLGQPMPVYTPEEAARQLRQAGRFTRNQVHFWNKFYGITLEAYGDVNGDGECFMPRNALNKPNAASLATGGGMGTNIYGGGIFELTEDETMIIELHQPIEPDYIGFCLGNMWGESLDFSNYQSSLNGVQAHRDADNVIRYVIAHRDPGVHNWVDTTGQPEGYIGVRWAYSKMPTENLPWSVVKKVPFNEVMQHLPADTRMVTPQERRHAIAIRQEHVQRRYRHH
ncbi:MAG: hypothetical protein IPO61_10910 [Gammaproteobacteria bacterium]|nr:hypothetical protein [Gammaproteobacteria bacterium]